MTADVPDSESEEAVPSLPEKILPADLDALNQALAMLFGALRVARGLPPGDTQGRKGAVRALIAAWKFLMRFEAALTEGLHIPLLNLSSALVALDDNNIEPILKPTKRTGRPASSPRRYAVIGIAVGAAQRLEWAGLAPAEANKVVATKVGKLGIEPARGKNSVTADTLRRWREQVNTVRPLLRAQSQPRPPAIGVAEDGWIIAATNAESMLTAEDRTKIASLDSNDARRFILSALEQNVRKMELAFPVKPPS
jgi:hypothetical protein